MIFSDFRELMFSLTVAGMSCGMLSATPADTLGCRPDHVNNALTPHFPAVFNQDGGSCGSASRIGYMFTHEINAYRGTDASLPENIYPTHFTWLLTNSHSGKEGMAMANGVPNSAVYGGTTYSRVFGNQDCAAADFGWMQGYDKWYSAMFNRISHNSHAPCGVDTHEGREWVKNWLWNHCGDTSFAVGGIAGIGVASACKQGSIPDDSLGINRAAGVVGQKYVTRWGDGVDHALTIVGYDDRILFDLDGNGVCGEADKDERGAWIIVNSWGPGWANGGFIYCPYKYGFPVRQQEGGAWKPEVYHVRKDYRPLRTLKVRMAYSRRSELKLLAGISSDLSATRPERTVELEHFKYAGDGSNNRNKFGVETRTPMLGRWADGVHEEPMEFGYDLTDLSDGFDTSRPLKYFFIIESRKDAIGTGKVHACSVIDYEFDSLGVETPMDAGKGCCITSHGEKTTLTAVVDGEPYYAPLDLRAAADGMLRWERPQASCFPLRGYVVCRDGQPVDTVTATTYVPDSLAAAYTVRAAYGDAMRLSAAAGPVVPVRRPAPAGNGALDLRNAGFVIPDVMAAHHSEATVEYWLRPRSWQDWNQAVGRGWGNFLIHASDGPSLASGWNTDARIDPKVSSDVVGRWTHFAHVVSGDTLRVYVNGQPVDTLVGKAYAGVGGFGDWHFGTDKGGSMDGELAEVRIWSTARTGEEIRGCMDRVFSPAALPAELLSYCRAGRDETGAPVWTDVTGRRLRMKDFGTWQVTAGGPELLPSADYGLDFGLPSMPVRAGETFCLQGRLGTGLVAFGWRIPSAGISLDDTRMPEFILDRAGTYDVRMYGVTPAGDTVTVSKRLIVNKRQTDAAFRLSAARVSAGERVSFLPLRPVPGGRYEWRMPGSDKERAATTKAAACYEQAGDYRVRLRVTDPLTGSRRRGSLRFTVHTAVPVAAFDLSDMIVRRGDAVRLTDRSRFAPVAWAWRVASERDTLLSEGRQVEVKPDVPGVYDVCLAATNEAGTGEAVRRAALIVCNADSRNGLNFADPAAAVITVRAPYDGSLDGMTLEWWMNAPMKGAHAGFGHSAATWQVQGDAAGRLTLTADSMKVSSDKGFVLSDRWHHYAVRFDRGEVCFLRDGRQVCKRTLKDKQRTVGTLPAIPTLTIGGTERPMNAAIDELRLWGKPLADDELQRYANAPLSDPAEAARRDGLLLYYDFNQNGGDVQDRSPRTNTGVRTNFGPDGDAWGLSSGVFCLGPVAAGR